MFSLATKCKDTLSVNEVKQHVKRTFTSKVQVRNSFTSSCYCQDGKDIASSFPKSSLEKLSKPRRNTDSMTRNIRNNQKRKEHKPPAEPAGCLKQMCVGASHGNLGQKGA